ncbi:hypothetical protein IAD21_04860 [Abditibacteriota bacterium]|nr:hypothetical protein IAD21_04860 [Abditibacteriota bacterium]
MTNLLYEGQTFGGNQRIQINYLPHDSPNYDASYLVTIYFGGRKNLIIDGKILNGAENRTLMTNPPPPKGSRGSGF